jgi:DNA (cytosine-5)-methyltransferase 1
VTLYNEIEPYAAEWLRNLAAAGHIAEGRVDERSIAELRPEDISPAEQFHTFAGIGVWSHALRLARVPDSLPVWTGSCPCQPFSAAGAGHGFADPRHLWPEWFRLIRECRPPLIFGEQVASPDGLTWLDLVQSDLEGAGYAFAAFDLCAASFGAPHIRQRFYFCAYRLADANATRQLILGCRGLRADRDASRGYDANGRGKASGRGSAVGDTEEGRRRSGRTRETSRDARQPDRSGSDRGMADSESGRRGEGCLQEGLPDERRAGSSDGSRMGDTSGTRSGRHAGSVSSAEGSGTREGLVDRDLANLADYAGADRRATAGFWDPCEWIPCRDPKRGIVFRPIEPGTFPLAHGATARVGRLRAYGNAIVAPQAAEFIGCALDAIADGF